MQQASDTNMVGVPTRIRKQGWMSNHAEGEHHEWSHWTTFVWNGSVGNRSSGHDGESGLPYSHAQPPDEADGDAHLRVCFEKKPAGKQGVRGYGVDDSGAFLYD